MRNFKELLIWKKGIEIAIDIYKLTGTFPASEKFGLISQMTRCAVSISSNIAEGSSRKSEKDYHRFIEIALGSCFELETQLVIAKAVNFITNEQYLSLSGKIFEEQKILSSFMHTLKY